MVRAEVKSVHVSRPPDDSTHFGVTVQAFIGPTDGDRSDSFDVLVCTPGWLTEAMAAAPDDVDDDILAWEPRAFPRAIRVGTRFWFTDQWDEAEVRRLLDSICDVVGAGPDWGRVASRIAQYIPWEYAYRYDAHEQAGGGPFPPAR